MSHMAFVTKQKCGEDPFHSSSFMTKVESFLNPICICFVSLNKKDMLFILLTKKEIAWRVAIW